MNNIVAIIISSMVSSLSIFAQDINKATWEYVSTIQDEWMNKVYAHGSDTVFIVGEQGLIAKSTDKALTWEKQYLETKVMLNDILFCNDQLGFIVGNNGTILKTEDTGVHWKAIPVETSQDIHAVAATGLDNIWVVGNGGLVMQSKDEGETWVEKNLTTDNRDLHDIQLRDELGYITGKGKNILKTINGGVTWTTQVIFEDIEDSYITSSLNITENKVYARLYEQQDEYDYIHPHAIISTENNSEWIKDNRIYHFTTGIYFSNDLDGLLIAHDWPTFSDSNYRIFVFQTKDGGKYWESVPSLTGYKLTQSGRSPMRSNYSFTKDNVYGYCLTGEVLFRSPYTGEFIEQPGGTNQIKGNSDIKIKKSDNKLWITSSQIISKVEIISVAGMKLVNNHSVGSEILMDIDQLPIGIYLIRIVLVDKTNFTVKWTKQ